MKLREVKWLFLGAYSRTLIPVRISVTPRLMFFPPHHAASFSELPWCVHFFCLRISNGLMHIEVLGMKFMAFFRLTCIWETLESSMLNLQGLLSDDAPSQKSKGDVLTSRIFSSSPKSDAIVTPTPLILMRFKR